MTTQAEPLDGPAAKPAKKTRPPKAERVPAPAKAPPPAKTQAEIDMVKLYLAFGAMVVGQFMAILDIQIVAASLPQIQAGIGASNDEISWIQTAYLIPEVVMIPLSGYLSRLWGTQKVFMASCAAFVVMSVLTGLSSNIDEMIITRALQGFLGGAMIPTIWGLTFTVFPPKQRVTATVIMTLIVSLAPTIGPTLGGHLTEWLNWRWLFFINVPPGLLVLFMVGRWGDLDKGDPSLAKGFDWFGLAIMATFLMTMQYVLEEGAKNDWLNDPQILLLAIIAVLGGVTFVWRSLTYFNPIVGLKAFGDRNFALGVGMTFVSGMTLFGGTFLMPLFLGRVRGFSASEIGTTMMVSGICMFIGGPIAGRLVRKMDPRLAMFLGFEICAFGFWLGHGITAQWGYWQFAGLQAFRSFGVLFAMIASQMVTMSTLPPSSVKNASGLVNLFRNVGGAVALAILSTTLSQQTARHLAEMASRVTATSTGAANMIAGLTERFTELGVADPDGATRKAFFGMLYKQASVLAFGDGFSILAAACFVAGLAALLTKPAKAVAAPVEMH